MSQVKSTEGANYISLTGWAGEPGLPPHRSITHTLTHTLICIPIPAAIHSHSGKLYVRTCMRYTHYRKEYAGLSIRGQECTVRLSLSFCSHTSADTACHLACKYRQTPKERMPSVDIITLCSAFMCDCVCMCVFIPWGPLALGCPLTLPVMVHAGPA